MVQPVGESRGDSGRQISGTEKAWLRSGGHGSRTRSRNWVPLIVGAGVVVLVAGLGVWQFRASPPRPTLSMGSGGGSTSAALSPSAPLATPVLPADVPAPAVPPPSVISLIQAPATKRLPVPAASSHAPAPSTVPAPPKSAAPLDNCNPPYYVDSRGNRVFKPECL